MHILRNISSSWLGELYMPRLRCFVLMVQSPRSDVTIHHHHYYHHNPFVATFSSSSEKIITPEQ